MSQVANHRSQDSGFEIAISNRDLFVRAHCHILEKRSTDHFEEVPDIPWPRQYGPTNQVIQDDQSFAIMFNWTVYGPLACLLDCGYWKCTVMFEQMGGHETHFEPYEIVPDRGIDGHRYTGMVEVRHHSLRPGVYRVITCLQWCFKNGNPGPITGFHDKGMLKIYADKANRREVYADTSNGTTTELPQGASSES